MSVNRRSMRNHAKLFIAAEYIYTIRMYIKNNHSVQFFKVWHGFTVTVFDFLSR